MAATISHDIRLTSLADIVEALDGPIAITECSSATHNRCELTKLCPARSNLQLINQAVLGALDNITLAQMTRPLKEEIVFKDRPAKDNHGSINDYQLSTLNQ